MNFSSIYLSDSSASCGEVICKQINLAEAFCGKLNHQVFIILTLIKTLLATILTQLVIFWQLLGIRGYYKSKHSLQIYKLGLSVYPVRRDILIDDEHMIILCRIITQLKLLYSKVSFGFRGESCKKSDVSTGRTILNYTSGKNLCVAHL